MYELDRKIYKLKDLDDIINSIPNNICKDSKHIKYFNIPFAFDIETTSFKVGEKKKNKSDLENKRATMYAFVFGINNKCIIARSWQTFIKILNRLRQKLNLNNERRIIVYVHNLEFEFQFIRKWLKWDKIFADDMRAIIYAISDGIEFRCSYRLSGYSLKKVGEHLQKYRVQKMIGDLDYKKLRHSKTPLTQKELGYILNDGLVVLAYIQEEIENHNNKIINIELTNTGRVRKYCRTATLYGGIKNHRDYYSRKAYKKYRSLMKYLTITSDEYLQAKFCFQGGFTHSNIYNTKKTLYNVASYDFTSAYPSVMLTQKYPMAKPRLAKIENVNQLKKYLDYYCCIFNVEFKNLRLKENIQECYISSSKCLYIQNPTINNGRVMKANLLSTTITEVDFRIINQIYDYDTIKISNFRYMNKGYLPIDFVNSILELYRMKTELKGIKGKEVEYLNSKGMLNSTFGMCVMDINKDEILYENDIWSKNDKFETLEKDIEKYNKDVRRFLYYYWGLWITAYNRENLFKAILELKEDYVYADTDSVKFLNYEKHKDWFDNYNKENINLLKYISDLRKIDLNKFMPKTIDNKIKPIGNFDFEGIFYMFKTLGAKRYIDYKFDKKSNEYILESTIAGVSKEKVPKYLIKKYKDINEVFNNFDDNLTIPKSESGKLTHTYCDFEISGELTDYTGKKAKYKEKSFIHLEEVEYNLSLSVNYANLIFSLLGV